MADYTMLQRGEQLDQNSTKCDITFATIAERDAHDITYGRTGIGKRCLVEVGVGGNKEYYKYTEGGWELDTTDIIEFNTSMSTPTILRKGMTYWNDSEETTDLVINDNGGILQVGREFLVNGYNNSGGTIPDGSPVYVSGVNAGRIEISLCNANDYETSRILGVTTETISNGETGEITKLGLVRNFDSGTLAVGLVYLDETDGGLTNTIPTGESFSVAVGELLVASPTEAILFVDTNKSETSVEVTDTNGFSTEGREKVTLNFVDATRTFSIAPVGSSFYFYQDGLKYKKDSIVETVLANTEGIHAIYFDNGVLESLVNPTDTEIQDLIINKCLIAYIYWDATNNAHNYFGNELHGISMSPKTHSYLHFTRGAQYLYGLGLEDINTNQTGDLDAHAQFGTNSGAIMDEDLMTTMSSITHTTGLPIYHLDGADVNLRRTENSGFSVVTTGTGRLAYNEFTGTEWQLTEVPNKDCCLYHVFAINGAIGQDKMISIMGQNVYDNKGDARDGAESEISNLLSIIPIEEITPIGTVVFEVNDNYDNAVKARIIDTNDDDDYVDWRTTELKVGMTSSSHSNLSNLQLAGEDSTWGHIDNQAQDIYGAKNFVDGLTATNLSGTIGTRTEPSLSYDGAGTLTVGAGAYVLNEQSDFSGRDIYTEIDTDTIITLTENVTAYICVEYNGGTPIITKKDISSITVAGDIWIVATVVALPDNTLSVINWGENALGASNKLTARFLECQRFQRASGLGISANTSLELTVASGIAWQGTYRNLLSQVSSVTDECYLRVNTGDISWSRDLTTTFPNTQYDDKSGTLQSLSVDNYAVVWIFRSMSSSEKIHLLLGNGDYTLNEAVASDLPVIPQYFASNTLLLGRIIIKNGDTTPERIDSAFDTLFAPSVTSVHNGLVDIQGGDAGERYHLNKDEYDKVSDWNPLIGAVVQDGDSLPTVAGYYVFVGVATGGNPTGVVPNNIYTFNGASEWELYREYESSNTAISVGATTTLAVPYFKSEGSWIEKTAPTMIVSPDEDKKLEVTNYTLSYNDGTEDRVVIDDDSVRLYTQKLGLGSNPAQIYAYSDTDGEPMLAMYDGDNIRVGADKTSTFMASPNGSKLVDVSDTKATILGDLSVLDGGTSLKVQSDSLTFDNGADELRLEIDETNVAIRGGFIGLGTLQPNLYLGGTSGLPLFTLNDGLNDRVYMDKDDTSVFSPDRAKSLTVTNLGIGIMGDVDVYGDDGIAIALNGGLNKTSSVYFSEVGNPRFAVQYDGAGASPNNLLKIKASPASAGSLSNTAITINQEGKVILGNTLEVTNGITSLDGDNIVTVSDSGLLYNDGVDRLIVDENKSKIASPNGAANISLADDGFTCFDGAQDRVKVTATETYIASPDETNTLSVTNDKATVEGNLTIYNPEGIDIKVNTSLSKQGNILFQESSNTYFGINHDSAASSPYNTLKLKTSTSTDGVLDTTSATIKQSGEINFTKGISMEETLEVAGGIVSPDGTNSVDVADDGTTVTGDLEVTGKLTVTKGYGQATFSGVCVDDSSLPMSAEECSDGTIVTFDITNNTFTLKGGRTYKAEAVLGAISYAATTDNVAFRITKNGWLTTLGLAGRIYPLGSAETRNSQPTAVAILSPTTDTTYRVYSSIVEGTVTLGSVYSGITITEL